MKIEKEYLNILPQDRLKCANFLDIVPSVIYLLMYSPFSICPEYNSIFKPWWYIVEVVIKDFGDVSFSSEVVELSQ